MTNSGDTLTGSRLCVYLVCGGTAPQGCSPPAQQLVQWTTGAPGVTRQKLRTEWTSGEKQVSLNHTD